MVVCNSTLSETHWKVDPVVGTLTFHTLGWIICAGCTLISTLISLFLIYKHASNYTNRNEQRQIMRILFMVPIYSITTMFSYVWYWRAVYWTVARDCYEAFAVASFFALMCYYIAPELHDQKVYFSTIIKVDPWPWPVTWIVKYCGNWGKKWRQPRNGLTWFNIIWICIFQYCFVRVATTIIATVTQVYGRYCEDSMHPAFAHVWCITLNCIAVTVAMYMLIAFFMNIKNRIADKRPMMKFLCIKLVIFLSFWQMIVCSLLSSLDIIEPSRIISEGDIAIGFNALLVCFEMIIFSIFHLFAFPAKPYMAKNEGELLYCHRPPRTRVARAILDAFNPFDVVKAFARGIKWMFVGRKIRHVQAEKLAKSTSIHTSTQPLVAHAELPGAWPNPGGLGVYAPLENGAANRLTVEHPTPSQQEDMGTVEDDIPTHGFAETEHTGWRPRRDTTTSQPGLSEQHPPLRPHPPPPPINTNPQPPLSPLHPTASPLTFPNAPSSPQAYSPRRYDPNSPMTQHPGALIPGFPTRSPTSPNAALPYPPSEIGLEMPNPQPYTSPHERQDLLLGQQNPFQPPVAANGGGGGGGYMYGESMVDSQGVYGGPNSRRRRESEADRGREGFGNGGERWREV